MKILVLGGTRFFGIHMVNALINYGHDVTIATRGLQKDPFGQRVKRLIIDRQNQNDLKKVFENNHYDLVIDKIAYASNDIKKLMDVISCDRYMLMSTTAVYEYVDYFDPYIDTFSYVNRNDYAYRITKRYAECALVQDYPKLPCVIVRYPFVVGLDDYTKRISFFIEHILSGKGVFVDNLDTPLHFIDSQEAGEFMAHLANEKVTGIFDGASQGEMTTKELIEIIEQLTGKKAILNDNGDPSPYNDTPYFSVDTKPSSELNYYFSYLSDWMEILIKQLIVDHKENKIYINDNNYIEVTTINHQNWVSTIKYENKQLLDLLIEKLEEEYADCIFSVASTNELTALLDYQIIGGYTQNNTYYHLFKKAKSSD